MTNSLDEAITRSLAKGSPTGELNPEQVAFFTKNTDFEKRVFVYREYKPLRDSVEYTVYFRAPSKHPTNDAGTRKYRLDVEIYSQEIDEFRALGLEGQELEDALAIMLRIMARAEKCNVDWELSEGHVPVKYGGMYGR